jgi:hypothetical protein
MWSSVNWDRKDAAHPGLEITGTRLDAPAPPLTFRAGSYTEQFIMSGVNFPTKGCWEITGRSKGAEVRFVVRAK